MINAKKVTWGTNLGDSIAVNGCDLTAVYIDEDGFLTNVIEETYKRTNLGDLKPGDPVNLERALTLAGRIGGHLRARRRSSTRARWTRSRRRSTRSSRASRRRRRSCAT